MRRAHVLKGLVALLGVATALAVPSVSPSRAAPPRGAPFYSVTLTVDATRTSAWEAVSMIPGETCPRTAISLTKRLTLVSRFYVALPRGSRYPLLASNRAFRNPWEGRARMPATGQVAIAAALGPTAEGCDVGEAYPATSCNPSVRVTSLQIDTFVFLWYLQAPNRLTQDSPCTQMATAFDSEVFTVGADSRKPLRPLLLRRKPFTLRGAANRLWGEGTDRLTWSARFTPIKNG